MSTVWENQYKGFLEGVVGVCQATHAERHFVWNSYHYDRGLVSWVSGGGGPGVKVGEIAGEQVWISLLVDVIEGQKILWVDATSQVVDHRMIEDWLKKHLPQSAFNDRGYINSTDATNFWNVLPKRPEKIETCRTPPDGWSCSRKVGHTGPCAATRLKPVGMQSSFASHSTSCNRQKGGSFCDCGVS